MGLTNGEVVFSVDLYRISKAGNKMPISANRLVKDWALLNTTSTRVFINVPMTLQFRDLSK